MIHEDNTTIKQSLILTGLMPDLASVQNIWVEKPKTAVEIVRERKALRNTVKQMRKVRRPN